MKKTVRVRFAPSPTGLLHIGGVRTALFNYLFAKNQNGQFILRLEDTDRERFDKGSVAQIEESLKWLDLIPDEGYWLGKHSGDVGPYVQSKRLPHYQEYANKLIASGLAYYSNATADHIAKWRQRAVHDKKPFVYKKQLEKDLPELKHRPIRFDTEAFKQKFKTDDVIWEDEIRGQFHSTLDLVDDFVIIKSDTYPTYNLANVIDDHLMIISHVIRGDEFIASTAKHVMLYTSFDWEKPTFIHLPAILGPDGKKKLSKRDGDVDVLEYKKNGYLSDALSNFLVLLGWNDGSEQEIFTRSELVNKFSINRIQKSPAVFDKSRLDWMNGEYIRSLTPKEFSHVCVGFLPSSWQKDHTYLHDVLELEQERIKNLAEIEDVISFFFEEPKLDIDVLIAKTDSKKAKQWLDEAITTLDEVDNTREAIEKGLRELCERLQAKSSELFYLIRVALTGRTAAPGLFDTIVTLNQDRVKKRLEKAIDVL